MELPNDNIETLKDETITENNRRYLNRLNDSSFWGY